MTLEYLYILIEALMLISLAADVYESELFMTYKQIPVMGSCEVSSTLSYNKVSRSIGC